MPDNPRHASNPWRGPVNSHYPPGTAVFSSDAIFSPLVVMKQSALENDLRQRVV